MAEASAAPLMFAFDSWAEAKVYVVHSTQFVAARERLFPVLRAPPVLGGTGDSPVTVCWSRRFGCGHAARWGTQSCGVACSRVSRRLDPLESAPNDPY